MNYPSIFDYRPSFHNTTNLKGRDLEQAEYDAETQETVIMAYFLRNPGPKTACEVWQHFSNCGRDWPIGSIRRAITNLYKRGTLEKTDIKRLGIYGAMCYCYELRTTK